MSPAAEATIASYQRMAGESASTNVRARAERVLGTLALYAPDTFSERALDAAALQQVAGQVWHRNRPARRQAAANALLAEYFTSPTHDIDAKGGAYVGTLLGDGIHIDRAGKSYMGRLEATGEAWKLDGHHEITPDTWATLRVGANVPEMVEVARTTNVESQIARAALVADYLYHPVDDDARLLSDTISAEYFYTRLLEAYGLHAFDMLLQSNAGKTRALKSGHERELMRAMEVLDTAKQIEIEDIMYKLFGKRPHEHRFQTSSESMYDEAIIFSTTDLSEISNEVPDGVLNARFKAAGSYVWKGINNPEYDFENGKLPADVFGVMAIVDNEQQLGSLFDCTVQRLLRDDDIRLVTAASKQMPLYIQGTPEFIENIYGELSPEVARLIQLKQPKPAGTPTDQVYQVAKFTCEVEFKSQTLPIEFQFQTTQDRANARLGHVSHMSHGAGEGLADIIPGAAVDLEYIYRQKSKIDSRGEHVAPGSISNGYRFGNELYKAI